MLKPYEEVDDKAIRDILIEKELDLAMKWNER